jgi:group I intron endonuclease
MMTVYSICNRKNGKIYVGITKKTLKRRWSEHTKFARGGKEFYLSRAIRKWGVESFVIFPLVEFVPTRKEAGVLETMFIALYDSTNDEVGYNMTPGGEGHCMTTAERKRMSEARKGLQAGEKNPFFGKKHSAETRAIMSAASKGVPKDPAVVARRAASLRSNGSNKGERHHMFGKKWTAEQIELFRQRSSGANNAMFGKPGQWLGRKHTAATRERMAERRRQFWANKSEREHRQIAVSA